MDDKKILEALEEKLTGNIEEDFQFLIKEANHFKSLGLIEMVNQTLRLLEKRYGDEAKQFLLNKAKESFQKRKEMFQEVIDLEKKKEYAKAQEQIVKLIDTFPINRPIKDNQQFVSFNNLFEHMYYDIHLNKERKVLLRLEEPYASYYFHLGYNLFYLEDYEETIKVLDTAIQYDGVFTDAYILQGESYLKLGNIDKFFVKIEKGLELSYNRFQIANCYYLLSKYFYDVNDKKASLVCAYLSNSYIVSDQIQTMLKQINEMPGEAVNPTDVEEMKSVLENKKIQFGPNIKILSTLKKISMEPKIQENPNLKRYFLTLLYDISRDPKVKEEIDALPIEKNK